MPRKALVPREDPSTEVRIGQVWEHRWTHRQTLVTGVMGTQVVYEGSQQGLMKRSTLLRDYRLVTA